VKPKFELTHHAKSELKEIAELTREKWGHDQARKYLKILNDTFEMLSKHPKMGKINKDYKSRFYFKGRHSIFYLIKDGFIQITDIVHQRSDFENTLEHSKDHDDSQP